MNFLSSKALIIFVSSLMSCADTSVDYAIRWTKEIKKKVLEDAEQKPDSINIELPSDNLKIMTLYKNKVLLKRIQIDRRTSDTLSVVMFSKDQNFAVGRELCPLLGDQFVEAVAYKQTIMGLHEFYYCDGKMKKSGMNLGGYIGEWKEYDEMGNVIKTTDYGNVKALDTLKKIKFYR